MSNCRIFVATPKECYGLLDAGNEQYRVHTWLDRTLRVYKGRVETLTDADIVFFASWGRLHEFAPWATFAARTPRARCRVFDERALSPSGTARTRRSFPRGGSTWRSGTRWRRSFPNTPSSSSSTAWRSKRRPLLTWSSSSRASIPACLTSPERSSATPPPSRKAGRRPLRFLGREDGTLRTRKGLRVEVVANGSERVGRESLEPLHPLFAFSSAWLVASPLQGKKREGRNDLKKNYSHYYKEDQPESQPT